MHTTRVLTALKQNDTGAPDIGAVPRLLEVYGRPSGDAFEVDRDHAENEGMAVFAPERDEDELEGEALHRAETEAKHGGSSRRHAQHLPSHRRYRIEAPREEVAFEMEERRARKAS